ncbi:putative transmembrane anti-sigma factor [Burkholderiales bacterium]|nr:putative transmembrane anti-sigma factor [Burkholderiales bacterium]
MTRCDDVKELLPLAADRELDPGAFDTLQAHLASCPACRARLRELDLVRQAIGHTATRFAAPALLRQRIEAQIGKQRDAPRIEYGGDRWGWVGRFGGWIAAAGLALVLLSLQLREPLAGRAVDEAFIDSHARALLTDHTIDVASSDRHSVKPWFRGKLEFSPPVVDLGGQGFELLGGRVDYVQRRTVAVLVYRRRQHVIDVFVWPRPYGAAASKDTGGAVREGAVALGYREVRWADDTMDYVAISDIDRADLQELAQDFQQSLRAAAGG